MDLKLAEAPPHDAPGPAAPAVESRPRRADGGCDHCVTVRQCLIGACPQARTLLGTVRRERSFQRGEVIMEQGLMSRQTRIVKVGTVFLCRTAVDGRPRPVAMAGRGTCLGLFSYFRQPSQLWAIAASSGRVCEFPTDRLDALASQDPQFRQRLGQMFCDNVGLLAQWGDAAARRSVTSAVAASLLLLAQQQASSAVVLPSQTGLAQLLGTTRESVARALATLEAAGCARRGTGKRCEVFVEPLQEWLLAQG